MIKKRGDNLIKNILYSKKFIALVGFLIIIIISLPLAKQVSKRYYIDDEIKDLENEIGNLESQNSNLEDFISYLESDSFVEEQARLNMGLKKEGEKVVVIKEEETKNDLYNREEERSINSNLVKWWKYFFVN